jgi:CRISPR-associated endonuclease/helicase Cas3
VAYLAHSASENKPPQKYHDHVQNVVKNGRKYLSKALHYAPGMDLQGLNRVLELATEYHDLGKLDDDNQNVLAGKKKAGRLPLAHADAGTAHLMTLGGSAWLSAFMVYAHHRGLPDLSDVETQDHPLRNMESYKNYTVAEWVDRTLPDLLSRHREALNFCNADPECPPMKHVLSTADLRILFACLTHADHGDTAQASGEEPVAVIYPELKPTERLNSLRRYVDKLPKSDGDRNKLRARFFESCSSKDDGATIQNPIVYCDAPVGTGKTTAVMAHLLRVAEQRGLRRIFVILPFTNIITQSARVYREALTLEGEKDSDVVAEIHHRVDFDDKRSRKLTALWDAPIVVTTAVAFFETLASARPSTLRRLQNLPGSAIFLDEAHAMLPVKLLPLAWEWIRYLSTAWSCHWVLASGSLCRFWELPEFQPCERSNNPDNILPVPEQQKLSHFELQRVSYKYIDAPMSIDEFVTWASHLEGPILIVLNTVHTAAAVAKKAESVFGAGNVIHLSTSLSPKDREITLDFVKARLRYKNHEHWCLIATSCVEAGVDLSFRTGIRECASLLSLLQLAGRVNRNSEYENADVWSISLVPDKLYVSIHPAFECSARILKEFFNSGQIISPTLATESMKRELRETGVELNELLRLEGARAFETVESKFKVIPDDTVPAVVDQKLIEKIIKYEDVSWKDVQSNSVRIRNNIVRRMAIPESGRYPGLYLWEAEYSPFLGYMEGVLRLDDFEAKGGAII